MGQRIEYDKGQFYKSVFALVIPLAVQNLINVGVSSADVIMLGKVGEVVLSGSSLAGQIYFIMSLIFFGLTSGAAVLTAQYWGKRDLETIEKVLGISMRVGVAVSLVFFVLVQLLPDRLMMIFTSEQAVIEEGVKYLRIICWTYPLTAVTMVYLNIMRSVEKVIISTVVYTLSLLLNVILNALLIFGLGPFPRMEIRGAAYGTLAARLLECVIVVFYACAMNKTVRFRFRNLFVTDPLLWKDFKIYAMPVLLNELLWGAGTSAVTAIIGHLGSQAVAANSVTQVTRQLSMVVCFGIASATAIILGKTIGEGREELTKVYASKLMKLTLFLGILGGALVLCVSPIARRFLTMSPQAKEYLRLMMYVMSYFCIGQALNTTMVVGVFRAGGDTKFGLLLDAASLWGGSVLLGLFGAFVLHLPVPAVYVLVMSDEIIKLPFSWRRYRSYKWLRNITR